MALMTTAAADDRGGTPSAFGLFTRLQSVKEDLLNIREVPSATFTSTQSGSWGNAATWGGAGVPGAADNVIISAGHTVTEDGDRTCSDLTVNGTLNMTNNFLFFQGAAFTNNGSIISSTGSGELRFNGVGAASGTMQAMAGAGTYNSSMPVELHIVQFTTVTPASGTVINGARAFNIDGGSTLSLGNTLVIKNGTILGNGGTVAGPGTLQSQGPVTLNFAGTATAPVEAFSGVTTGNGNFGRITVDGGATFVQNNNTATNGDLSVAAGGTLDLANAFHIFQGNTFTNNGTILSGTGSGEFRFNGVAAASGTMQAMAGNGSYDTVHPVDLHIVQFTTVTPASGTVVDGVRTFIIDGGSTLSLTSNLIVKNGTAISSGGSIVGTGTLRSQGPVTLNFAGSTTAPFEAVSGTTTGNGNFGRMTIDNGTTFRQNGTLTPNGDLTVASGSTVDMSNNFLLFQGNTFTDDGSIVSAIGHGEFRFNGLAGAGGTMQAMGGSGAYDPIMPVDIHIVQSTTVTPAVGTVIDGVRTFIIDGGSTLSLPNTLVVKNGTSISSGGAISGTATLQMQGPVALNSAGTMTAPLKAVSGTTSANGNVGKVTIDSGATLFETGSLTPNADLMVLGTLNMNNQFVFFQGPTFTNNGTIMSPTGNGEIRFNGLAGASGTTQGMAGSGTYILAQPVDLHIVQFTTVMTAGGTVVDGARSFNIDGGSTLSLPNGVLFKNGTTIGNGGLISGAGTLQTQGPVTINSPGTMTAPFEAASGMTMGNGNFGKTTIDAGATFQQTGDLTPNGDLTLNNGGTVDVNNHFLIFQGPTLTNNGSFTSSSGTGEFRFNGIGAAGGTTQHIASSSGTFVSNIEHVLQFTTVVQDGDVTLNSFFIDGGSTFQNMGTGQLTLAGDMNNGGTITFNGSGPFCGDLGKIRIRSSVPGTQRAWNGGTISITDVDVQDQAGSTQITAFNSINSGNMGSNWHFDVCAVTPTDFDFDGDGRADVAVFRPTDRVWYLSRSVAGFAAMQWGLPDDKLAPADFDGDGKTDISSWRGDSGDPDLSYYNVVNSFNNSQRKEQFGRLGDVPIVAGDWDGDGKADLAVYRNGLSAGAEGGGSFQSYFFYRPSAQPGADFVAIPWGVTSDRPMRGDFDGDGKLDAAVFRPSDNTWYILQSSNGQIRYESWGLQCDTFVPADYDGDGKTDLAVIRAGVWYIKRSSDGQAVYQSFGLASDLPVPADYDGDQKADIAVFRNGDWYILQSQSGTVRYVHFGAAGDVPVESAFTDVVHCAE
jgi:hypothetical protein